MEEEAKQQVRKTTTADKKQQSMCRVAAEGNERTIDSYVI